MVWRNKFESLDEQHYYHWPDEYDVVVVKLLTKVSEKALTKHLGEVVKERIQQRAEHCYLPISNVFVFSINVYFVDVQIEKC